MERLVSLMNFISSEPQESLWQLFLSFSWCLPLVSRYCQKSRYNLGGAELVMGGGGSSTWHPCGQPHRLLSSGWTRVEAAAWLLSVEFWGSSPPWMVKLYSLETQFMLSRILQLAQDGKTPTKPTFCFGAGKSSLKSSPQTKGSMHVKEKSGLDAW